jgi:hypothetical protein
VEVGVGPGDAYAEGYSLTPITEFIPGLVVTMCFTMKLIVMASGLLAASAAAIAGNINGAVTNVEATVSRTRPTEEPLLLVYFTPSKYTICFED